MGSIQLLSVVNQTTKTPPGSPNDGDTYIPAATATDEWAGHEGEYATAFKVGASSIDWRFQTPEEGHIIWDQSLKVHYGHNGTSFVLLVPKYTTFSDTPASLGSARSSLVVNAGATAIEHVLMFGTTFPTSDLYEGRPYYRTDLREQFHYHASIDGAARWIGSKTKSYHAATNANGILAAAYMLDGPANQSSLYRMDPLPWDAVIYKIQVFVGGTVTGTKFQVFKNGSMQVEVTKTGADTLPDGETFDVEDASFSEGEVPQLRYDQNGTGDSLDSPRMAFEVVRRIDA